MPSRKPPIAFNGARIRCAVAVAHGSIVRVSRRRIETALAWCNTVVMNSIEDITSALDTGAIAMGRARLDAPVLFLPIHAVPVALGFPSPAEDFEDDCIDLNRLLVRNPPATFFYRARGWSMLQAGICDGDVLIVDRSVRPQDGDVVIAMWDGNAPVCKVLQAAEGRIELHSRSPGIKPIVLSPESEVEVFAVVGVVRQVHRSHGRVGRAAA